MVLRALTPKTVTSPTTVPREIPVYQGVKRIAFKF
jgi:hypothetical protein